MKIVKIVIVVLLMSAVMIWIRNGDSASILEGLPIVGGHRPGIYDVGAIAMIVTAIWGIGRVGRARDDKRWRQADDDVEYFWSDEADDLKE